MNVVIVEDDLNAAEELTSILSNTDPSITVQRVITSFSELGEWVTNPGTMTDLFFIEMKLGGVHILNELQDLMISAPIIFVTAQPQYLRAALSYTCIDCIVKPFDTIRIEKAILKYQGFLRHFASYGELQTPRDSSLQKKKISRVVVRKGRDFEVMMVDEISYLFSLRKVVFVVANDNGKYIADIKSLNVLAEQLDPVFFFKVNRKYVVHINSIKNFRPGNRVNFVIELHTDHNEQIVVGQVKARAFKNWLSR